MQVMLDVITTISDNMRWCFLNLHNIEASVHQFSYFCTKMFGKSYRLESWYLRNKRKGGRVGHHFQLRFKDPDSSSFFYFGNKLHGLEGSHKARPQMR